ncbi:MAG: hypothetical protein NZ533_11235 [Casimicrobiaceae bacterium]|nr:hypothetical protein [Casimicrobiaceae bacterium]MDW8312674.1 hypothetical protein [Burkholderiales bacterium]
MQIKNVFLRDEFSSSARRCARALAVVSLSLLAGCAAIPSSREQIGVSATGLPIYLARHSSGAHSDFMFNAYQGETRRVNGRDVPYLSEALFDYPAHMLAWYMDHAEKPAASTGSVATGARIGATIPAPRSWQADALRVFAGTDAVLRIMGLGGAATMGWGQIGLSFLTAGMSKENTTRDWNQRQYLETVGSTLILVRLHPREPVSEHEALARLRDVDRIVGIATHGVTARLVSSDVRVKAPSPFLSSFEATFATVATGNSGVPSYRQFRGFGEDLSIYSKEWPLSRINRHPLYRFAPTGTVQDIRFRDIAYIERKDGIRSPRELYERVLRPEMKEADGWYVLYTDTDPEEPAVRRVFVFKHTDDPARRVTIKFDLPPPPFQ